MKRTFALFLLFIVLIFMNSCQDKTRKAGQSGHEFNGTYTGDNLNYIAFPIGGIGAGMVCLEGTGCLSHISAASSS